MNKLVAFLKKYYFLMGDFLGDGPEIDYCNSLNKAKLIS